MVSSKHSAKHGQAAMCFNVQLVFILSAEYIYDDVILGFG
jgi:hypothetical protein